MPKRTDLKSVLVIGSGPIVIGQACRIRLLRHPGTARPQGGGPAGHPRQLQPGHHHDGPRVRRRHLHRADHPRGGREDHRQGAPRRAPADPRRPDRPQHRHRAGQERRAGEVQRRADRRQHRRDRARRGPREVQGRRRALRRRVGPQPHHPHHGRGPRRRRGPRLPDGRPALLHHGRPRLRPRLRRGRPPPDRRPGPAVQPHDRGAARREHPRLEGVRARDDARQERQRRGGLLHRELRPGRRAHRRLDHRRPGPDPDGPRVPAAARHLHRRHPRGRRRHRRLQHPVRRRARTPAASS